MIGALGYVAYSYAIFAFTVAPNPATPLYLAILGLSAWALVLGIGRTGDPAALGAIASRLPRRGSGIFLIAVPIVFGLLWASEIAAAVTADGPTETLARAGLPTNPIWALDLAFALPVVAYGGVRLLRDDSRAAATALPALVFLVLIGLAVLGVFAYSAVDGEEVVLVPVIVVGIITLIAVSLTFVAVRPGHRATPDQVVFHCYRSSQLLLPLLPSPPPCLLMLVFLLRFSFLSPTFSPQPRDAGPGRMTQASRGGDIVRWLVGILLIGHALIHLMGPADIWGLADLEQLTGEPSIAVAGIEAEVLAILWLLPLTLLLAAGVALLHGAAMVASARAHRRRYLAARHHRLVG